MPVVDDTNCDAGRNCPLSHRQQENLKEWSLYFNTTGDGLFNLYVAMTTANHPDVFMFNYHMHWAKILVLVAFMFTVNLFLLNVFLAVVTARYGLLVRAYVRSSDMQAQLLLRSAFYLVVCSNDGDETKARSTVEPCHPEKLSMTQDQFMEAVKLIIDLKGAKYGSFDATHRGTLWFVLPFVMQVTL